MIKKYVIADDEEQALELVTEGYDLHDTLAQARKEIRTADYLVTDMEHPAVYRVEVKRDRTRKRC